MVFGGPLTMQPLTKIPMQLFVLEACVLNQLALHPSEARKCLLDETVP